MSRTTRSDEINREEGARIKTFDVKRLKTENKETVGGPAWLTIEELMTCSIKYEYIPNQF